MRCTRRHPPHCLCIIGRLCLRVSQVSYGVRLLGLCLPLHGRTQRIMDERISPVYKTPERAGRKITTMAKLRNQDFYFRPILGKSNGFSILFAKVLWVNFRRTLLGEQGVCNYSFSRCKMYCTRWTLLLVLLLNLGVLPAAQAQHTVETLASFHGKAPGSITVDSDGNIFGTTINPDASETTIFEIAAGSHIVTTLFHGTSSSVIRLDNSGNILGRQPKGLTKMAVFSRS